MDIAFFKLPIERIYRQFRKINVDFGSVFSPIAARREAFLALFYIGNFIAAPQTYIASAATAMAASLADETMSFPSDFESIGGGTAPNGPVIPSED